MNGLGRLQPPDWEHVRKFPLAALETSELPRGTPAVGGFNWYTDFDSPIKIGGRWWICPDGKITGSIRGGHCIAIKASERDNPIWWTFYNQGNEGACVPFGVSRIMTDLNRHRYDAWWMYKLIGLPGGGAYVRDALEVLRTRGHVRDGHTEPTPEDGIAAYRWAQSVAEVVTVLNLPLAERLEAVPFLNSWGVDYPHITWMPFSVLDRLLSEDGEVGIVTDK